MFNTPPDPELSEESPPTDSRRRAVQTALETFLRHVRRAVTHGSPATDAAPTPVLVTDGGQANAKVIGHNQGSGQTVGVWGEVDSSDGCGFATPDDVRIDGTVLTNGTDFTVEAGTQSTDDAQNVVLGHASNTVAGGTVGVTIAGGGRDDGNADFSHVAYDNYGTIGGGENNQVGTNDDTSQPGATVAGGNDNTASGEDATVGGGESNTASDSNATVGGGGGNTASAVYATVAGGLDNTASGAGAMIPGGGRNEASGQSSFAAGYNALATKDDSFVWNGSEGSNEVESPDPYTFSVQADNGIWLGNNFSPSIGSDRFIDTSTGAYLSDGGTWTDSCSVTEKEQFTPTDSIDVLEKVDSLEVSTWQYRDDDGGARHMGPTAEQFHDTFGLGDDEHHIAPLDTAGVALAAIQELSTQIDQKDDRIEEVEAENDELRGRLADIEAHLGLDDSEISTDD